nr:glycerophosphodiester phosphodiesterase [Hyphomonas sp. Mor2]
MKRALMFVLGALILVTMAVTLWPAPAPIAHAYFDAAPKNRAEIIAHGGGQGHAPPNTILALQTALDLGTDVLEVDLQQTRDGVIILRHDDTLDRTTNMSGPIAEQDWAEISGADAGATWSVDGETFVGRGITIPTLDAALAAFPDARWIMEIKNDTPDAAQAVCRSIQGADAQSRVLVASFHDAAMATFRAHCPHVATSMSFEESRRFVIAARLGVSRFIATPAVALQIPMQAGGLDLTHPRLIDAAKARGIRVHYWTINDPADLSALLDAGADGVMTDYVDRAHAALANQAE